MDTEITPEVTDSASERIVAALSRLDTSRKPSVEKRAKQVPESARGGYLRSACGTASPRGAIKAHCMECVCWDRTEVTACTALACPLYPYRPFQVVRSSKDGEM